MFIGRLLVRLDLLPPEPDSVVAVALGVLRKVLLVRLVGRVKLGGRANLGHDLKALESIGGDELVEHEVLNLPDDPHGHLLLLRAVEEDG